MANFLMKDLDLFETIENDAASKISGGLFDLEEKINNFLEKFDLPIGSGCSNWCPPNKVCIAVCETNEPVSIPA